MFPKRFEPAHCPEYPELTVKLLANPSGKLYDDLLMGSTATEETKARLGLALVEVYAGGVYEGYGATFDFSTPEKALETITNDNLPADLVSWLRNAPVDIVTHIQEQNSKNFRRSLNSGN